MCREYDPLRRFVVNLGSFNVTVDAYCHAEKFPDAIKVFGKMTEKVCVGCTLFATI
jgi:pentatricopeptide repeat protein